MAVFFVYCLFGKFYERIIVEYLKLSLRGASRRRGNLKNNKYEIASSEYLLAMTMGNDVFSIKLVCWRVRKVIVNIVRVYRELLHFFSTSSKDNYSRSTSCLLLTNLLIYDIL